MVLADPLNRNILSALSENSRLTSPVLARRFKCSPKTIQRRIEKLEQEFQMKYTVELDERKLGLVSMVVAIKFKKKPTDSVLKQYLEQYPVPQFAAVTSGDLDLLLYVVETDHSNLSRWSNWFRQKMQDYIEDWSPSIIVGTWFGFFPLQQRLIQTLNIKAPQRRLLELLNEDARMPLKELAAKMKLPKSTAHYHLNQLLRSDYFKRCTFVMRQPRKNVHHFMSWKYKISSTFLKRDLSARNIMLREDPLDVSNKVLAAMNAIGTLDDFFIASSKDLESSYAFQEDISKTMRDVSLTNWKAVFLKTLLGDLPLRKLDIKKHYHIDWNVYDWLEQ